MESLGKTSQDKDELSLVDGDTLQALTDRVLPGIPVSGDKDMPFLRALGVQLSHEGVMTWFSGSLGSPS